MPSIFSKIIRGELPAEKVYETASELAFLDINPKSEGHTLVVPKLEVADFGALPLPELASLIGAVQLVTRGVTRAMGTPHYNLFLNNGAPAGQVIFHVHFHIVPRHQGGGRPGLPGGYEAGRIEDVGEKIRAAIGELQSGQA